jgi:tRNA nucleotidyltransferase (CCA-adding enzyme)
MARRFRARPPVKVYRVGGSVRDELLGRPVVDRDWVVVGTTPETLIASGYKPVGRDFPVFLHPETREEYALARTERKHGRGYRGFEFFASPDVTLEQDLARRDLTVNAMARDEDGALIDPFHGADDLREGVLRHVSPAFVEDPLRVLRVARFAARFDFVVAPETMALMRALAASGELGELAPERVWQELARGLMEPRPSRMFGTLRECGALARLLPEVDALFGAGKPRARAVGLDAARQVFRAIDRAATRGHELPVRYAVLAHDLGAAPSSGAASSLSDDAPPRRAARTARSVRLAEKLSERLKAPVECRDAARLAARWQATVRRAGELRPAALLDLLLAADALRRPERLDALLDACACVAEGREGADGGDAPGRIVRRALAAVKRVDAGAIARGVGTAATAGAADRSAAIAAAVRAARLDALRSSRREGALQIR